MSNEEKGHEEEMNNKIQKLIDHIKEEFPDGCGHPNNEYDCHEECPLYQSKAYSREHKICEFLGLGTYLLKEREKNNKA